MGQEFQGTMSNSHLFSHSQKEARHSHAGSEAHCRELALDILHCVIDCQGWGQLHPT